MFGVFFQSPLVEVSGSLILTPPYLSQHLFKDAMKLSRKRRKVAEAIDEELDEDWLSI